MPRAAEVSPPLPRLGSTDPVFRQLPIKASSAAFEDRFKLGALLSAVIFRRGQAGTRGKVPQCWLLPQPRLRIFFAELTLSSRILKAWKEAARRTASSDSLRSGHETGKDGKISKGSCD